MTTGKLPGNPPPNMPSSPGAPAAPAGPDYTHIPQTMASTSAINANTGAIKENLEAHKMFARLQDDEIEQMLTFREFLLKETKALQANAAALASGRTYLQEMRQAVGGLMQDIKTTTSLTAIYTRSLDQLRTGTAAYTSTMQAHTGAIGEAREQSTKFVEGMQAAQAQSYELAAKFNMDQASIAAAGEQATKMFATQLLAAGDVAGGIKSLQKEAVIMSRYFGTDMDAVMQSWNERMQHSNMTLEEAKDETALLSKVSDDYAKSLGKLGDKMLQTAQMGKKDFLELFKQINQEFKVGIPNAVALTAAMSKMSLVALERGATKSEQKGMQQSLLNLAKDITSTEGGWGVMAYKSAEKMLAQYRTAPGTMSTKEQERMQKMMPTIESAERRGDYKTSMEMVSETMRGSATSVKAALQEMKATGTGTNAMAQMLKGSLNMGTTDAYQIAEKINNGDLEQVFEENKELLEGQAKQQMTDAEKLVSEGAKTNSTLHNVVKELQSIKAYMIAGMIANPVLGALGGAVGGAITNKLLGTAAGALLPKIASAAVPTAASGFIGPVMPAGVVAMAGIKTIATAALPWLLPAVVAGAALYGGYKIYAASKEAEKLSVGGRRVKTGDVLNKQIDSLVGGDAGWQTKEFVMNMSFKELNTRKDKIKLLEDEIKHMKDYNPVLKDADRRIIEEKQRQADTLHKSIAGITAEENKMKAFTEAEISRRQLKKMDWMADKVGKGSAKNNAKELLSVFNPGVFLTSEFGDTLDTFLSSSAGKKMSKKSGGEDALRRALHDEISATVVGQRGLSPERMAYLTGKGGYISSTIAPDTEVMAKERSRGYEEHARKQAGGTYTGGVYSGGQVPIMVRGPNGDLVANFSINLPLETQGLVVAQGAEHNQNRTG